MRIKRASLRSQTSPRSQTGVWERGADWERGTDTFFNPTCLTSDLRPPTSAGLRRAGFSLIELQVALVVFGIALTGLCPLVVMQSKQLQRLERRFSRQSTYYLVPSTDVWARKLGAAASVMTQAPLTPTAMPQPAPAIDVQIQSLEKSLTSEVVTAHVSVQRITP